MNYRERQALDRHITGNYGEDQFKNEGEPMTAAEYIAAAVWEKADAALGICKNVLQADFLECNGNLGKFDRIIMNPPFEHGADIDHIANALTMLAPGGRLVALCANGPRQQEKLKPCSLRRVTPWPTY